MIENNQENNGVMLDNNSATEETKNNERLFTQDDVNRIVSERLTREREKNAQPAEDEREQALKLREARISCREYVDELPVKDKYKSILFEALDTSNIENFKAAAEKIIDGMGLRIETTETGATVPHPPHDSYNFTNLDARLGEIFKAGK